MHGHGDKTSWFFCALSYLYMSVMVFSKGEPNVRTDISMVFIPHDGDIVGHHILLVLESLVEDILTEMICQTLTS